MIRVCFHGAESTGKSVLAERLSRELHLPWVAEYGRDYAEAHGTDFTMEDLLAIAEGHEARVQQVAERGAAITILDTDPLMTAVWADMLFGRIPPELLAFPKADRYLLFAPDVPWTEDGTRLFGSASARTRFAELAEAILIRSCVTYQRIGGNWAERERQVRSVIADLT